MYGERNSATTYLRKLLQDNMRSPQNFLGALESKDTPLGHRRFGYKHWFVDPEKLKDPAQDDTLFIVIYRDPYTWVRAMMTRPYALEKSIAGKSVAQLPKIKLTGHMNGKDTRNEFDPDTGEHLTLFELRYRKIQNFEAIKRWANNVVYVRMEDLLHDPDSVISRLAEQFPSVFAGPLTFERRPYRQLMEELRVPPDFDAQDMNVLEASIDWRWENAVGYEQGGYGASGVSRSEILIIHGGSAAGKSSAMAKIAQVQTAFRTLEMDDCRYWDEATPELSLQSLQFVLPRAQARDLAGLKGVLPSRSRKMSRCANYLLSRIGLDIASSECDQVAHRTVATCGALPLPAAPDVESLYSWLEARLPVRFRHVLLDIPSQRHQEQIAQRGRTHLASEIENLHSRMVASRHYFDTAVPDFSGIAAYLGVVSENAKPLEAPAAAPDVAGAAPHLVRIKQPELRQVQIFGERSSGTKYLTTLMCENMKEPGNVLGSYASKKDPVNKAKPIGYKHYYPNLEKVTRHQRDTLFLVIHKNPYTWIRSMLGKPYHFKACLDGKGILDLPDLELAGFDIHGNEIPDVHPVSGERLTMFGLRKHKILEWERLSDHVDNIAYVNYEHLLLKPTQIIQSVTDAFPSLFASAQAPQHVPDERYVAKYVTPEPFRDEEMAAMDENIDWEAEAILGYRKGNLFI